MYFRSYGPKKILLDQCLKGPFREKRRKEKTFSQFFSACLESSLNFENFSQKKTTLIAEIFAKLRAAKNMVTSMSKKSRFKRSFGKQHGKRAQTLLKFAWQYLYHIY